MKNLGYSQNFLVNKKLVERLISKSNIDVTDYVIEIGPGKGIITDVLSQHAGEVVAVEYDQELYNNLVRYHSHDNVTYIFGDFLKYKLPLNRRYKIFSNIPFQIYNLAFLLSDGYKRTYSSYISDIPVPFRLMSVQELTQYDMIAFCGGNAHTLLSEINRTGFSKPLKQAIENGLVYLGISAGSMIAAGNFSDGLGYLANPLIPHAEKESPFGDISKNDLIELADGQTVLIKGNRQEII